MEKLIAYIEEGLAFNDENRKKVQSELQALCSGMTQEIDQLEDRLSQELMKAYHETEERTNTLYKELSEALSSAQEGKEGGTDRLLDLAKSAQDVLATNSVPSLKENEKVTSISDEYELTREAAKEQPTKGLLNSTL